MKHPPQRMNVTLRLRENEITLYKGTDMTWSVCNEIPLYKKKTPADSVFSKIQGKKKKKKYDGGDVVRWKLEVQSLTTLLR